MSIEGADSKLVSHVNWSPNHSGQRKHSIDTVTIHCVVGQTSVESLGSLFAKASRKASSTYGVGFDGRIGQYVKEANRSWCSSSSSNDHRAITIEVASDTTHPYAVNDKAYNALITLLVDICKRNNIKKLIWSTNKEDRVNHRNGCNMTVHRDYANKSCPGEYLYSRHQDIADKVNKQLGVYEEKEETNSSNAQSAQSTKIKAGDKVKFTSDAVQWNKKAIPSSYKTKTYTVKDINESTGRTVLTINNVVMYAVDIKCLVLADPADPNISSPSSNVKVPFLVKVIDPSLNIRKGPSASTSRTGIITDKGTYTIIEVNGDWGRLKSKVGWIHLGYTKKL